MSQNVLWIEDDYFSISALFRPLMRDGFRVDSATSAVGGYRKFRAHEYDLFVVDLILPTTDEAGRVPDEVRQWEQEEYVGIGLLKWLIQATDGKKPVIVLSVVRDPQRRYRLEDLTNVRFLLKRGLLPAQVKAEVLRALGHDQAATAEGDGPG